jgi:hypothetical protein
MYVVDLAIMLYIWYRECRGSEMDIYITSSCELSTV